MRVLVAPDGFAGTLSAPQAADAIVAGWNDQVPGDDLTILSMSDGGPGFVGVLHRHLGGRIDPVEVRGAHGRPAVVEVLRVADTAYIESAQACGRHLSRSGRLEPWSASTHGVGQAIAAAIARGAQRVVVGLGGSGTNDGGAGLLGALGAVCDVALDAGPAGLRDAGQVELAGAREAVRGVELIAAADVDCVLLGLFGATKTFGPQKGLDDDDLVAVDAILDRFVAAACGSTPAQRRVADEPGTGAAGGVGFAMRLLGAQLTSGIDLVAEAIGLSAACGAHDLVVTGEGTFDHTSRAGKVVHGVARTAAAAARPTVVIAGQVSVGSREARAMGVEAAYAVAELEGLDESLQHPAQALRRASARVARTWSHGGRVTMEQNRTR